jgi:hypothetical protein
MKRTGVIAAVSLALAGCSSFAPGNLMPFGGGYPLRLESEPPGAEARTSLGQTCRTPCIVPVPAGDEFTVSFALNGYEPQAVPVSVLRAAGFEGSAGIAFSPNPVVAVLEPAPPPQPAAKKKPTKAKPRASAKAAPKAPAPAPDIPPSAVAPPSTGQAPASERTIPGAQPTAPASALPAAR